MNTAHARNPAHTAPLALGESIGLGTSGLAPLQEGQHQGGTSPALLKSLPGRLGWSAARDSGTCSGRCSPWRYTQPYGGRWRTGSTCRPLKVSRVWTSRVTNVSWAPGQAGTTNKPQLTRQTLHTGLPVSPELTTHRDCGHQGSAGRSQTPQRPGLLAVPPPAPPPRAPRGELRAGVGVVVVSVPAACWGHLPALTKEDRRGIGRCSPTECTQVKRAVSPSRRSLASTAPSSGHVTLSGCVPSLKECIFRGEKACRCTAAPGYLRPEKEHTGSCDPLPPLRARVWTCVCPSGKAAVNTLEMTSILRLRDSLLPTAISSPPAPSAPRTGMEATKGGGGAAGTSLGGDQTGDTPHSCENLALRSGSPGTS